MQFPYELGILGAGQMAEALARGVIASGLLNPAQILAADPYPARRELFQNQLGIKANEDNAAVARQSRRLLLSVKPQQMSEALAGIGAVMSEQTLLISIAAGISTSFIERALGAGHKWRIIRAMPNTPMLVGEGMVALSPGAHGTAEDLADARRFFQSAAEVIEVSEDRMNAVTALSGSGPAYFYYLVEHMIRAGVELGLTEQQAHKLATKTASGAAKLLLSGSDSPRDLRRKVTSPGGTTQAAIEHMESQRLGETIVAAIKAAEQRGKELGS